MGDVQRGAAPRRIASELRATIVHALREKLPLTQEQISHGKRERSDNDGIPISVLIERQNDAEALAFGSDLKKVFEEAKFRIVEIRVNPFIIQGEPVVGLFFVGWNHSDIIRDVFIDAGTPVTRADEAEKRLTRSAPSSYGVRICRAQAAAARAKGLKYIIPAGSIETGHASASRSYWPLYKGRNTSFTDKLAGGPKQNQEILAVLNLPCSLKHAQKQVLPASTGMSSGAHEA
jgi:hypothetical protein